MKNILRLLEIRYAFFLPVQQHYTGTDTTTCLYGTITYTCLYGTTTSTCLYGTTTFPCLYGTTTCRLT